VVHQFSVFLKKNRLNIYFTSKQGNLSEFDCEIGCQSVVTSGMAATGLCRAGGLGTMVSPQLRVSPVQLWVFSDETLDQVDYPN